MNKSNIFSVEQFKEKKNNLKKRLEFEKWEIYEKMSFKKCL